MTIVEELRLVEVIEMMYAGVATKILENLAKHFMLAEPPVQEFTYRQMKMAELQAVSQETLTIITEGTKLAPDALNAIMANILRDDFNDVVPAGIPVTTDHLQTVLLSLAEGAVDRYNLTNSMMLESTGQVYIMGIEAGANELNQTVVEVATGTEAMMRANRRAVSRMLDVGITGFSDALGRQWSPEAYINMVTRTTVHNARIQGKFAQMDDYGTSVFQVSSHAGARPLCAPYQGKFYSNDGTSGVVHDLDGREYPYEPKENTSFGDPAGLFGINCRHRPIMFIDGFSRAHAEPLETEEQREANRIEYEKTQVQRGQERDIRKTREKEACARAQGDTETADEMKLRARREYTEYRAWCEENGMTPRPDRTYIGERRL